MSLSFPDPSTGSTGAGGRKWFFETIHLQPPAEEPEGEPTMSKIVIALGGNALQTKNSPPTAQAQLEVVKTTCDHIAQLSAKGYELAMRKKRWAMRW